MAEQQNNTAIVNTSGEVLPPTYQLKVKDVGPGGGTEEISVPLPDVANWTQWGLLARSCLLKKTTFKSATLAEIIYACQYADNLGLDIVAGDVYMVDGRLNTTSGAKVKYAMRSGKIEGYEVEVTALQGDSLKLTKKVAGKELPFETQELEAVVTVNVAGWKRPFVYKARLSEWYVGHNPNWHTRPRYMLQLNAVAHALNMVVPMGTAEDSEAPPVSQANIVGEVPSLSSMKEAKKAV